MVMHGLLGRLLSVLGIRSSRVAMHIVPIEALTILGIVGNIT